MKLRQNLLPLAALMALAFSTMILLRLATPHGAGLINDSIAYIGGARAIINGQGYSEIWLASDLEPITHYPPLFSLTLSAIGLSGIDPLNAARWLNIFLLGLNGLLFGLIGWRATRSSWLAALIGSLYLLNADLFGVHSYAITEPLFLFFVLLAFLALDELLATRQKRFAAALGLMVGLAILTRYVGLALFAALGLTLWLEAKNWQERLQLTGFYLLTSLPLPIAWIARNELTAHVGTNRVAAFYGLNTDNLALGLQNLSRWLIPFPALWKSISPLHATLVALTGLAALAVIGWALWRGQAASRAEKLSLAGGVFGFTYLAMVLFSMSFFDPATRFLQRILAPLYLSLLFLPFFALERLWRSRGKFILLALILIWQGFAAVNLVSAARQMRLDGQGYAGVRWSQSGAATFLHSLPATTAIYSNSPPAIYATLERPSYIYFMSGDRPEEYALVFKAVAEKKAVLVLWGLSAEEADSPEFQQIKAKLALTVKSGRDWVFFGASQ
ncbi:MAG: hypothetical protein CO094_13485 [Anaerolineae bacterium CG_4_9_14_3_um_filter_57_17]|nr:phospholipid carrier-dependent glycosyltransferase [bacterium]NCT19797.1 phospholipid carrier-dependent glycosyltransferase [bacterium]OIO85502.1 MAG: hypothetical protein AUK01_05975 [Anaerolineae bacterium CG2_30_57_67]PJB64298.1 MAG: hypothetical protein CO094_13485 [Anaerolineae bacterium CG_4_9_14_3_um_filter_57_17]